MNDPLRVLLVEDSAIDAELALNQIKNANFTVEARRVQIAEDYRWELDQFRPQIILSDFSMPGFSGLEALAIAREFHPHIPFIFVSGTIGEESAIQALKKGATDYVLKSNMLRLPSAVERAIEETVRGGTQLEKTTRVNRMLIKICRQLMSGKRHQVSPRLIKLLERCSEGSQAAPLPHEQLSSRELQILLLIGDGRSIKQIGSDLAISINTVNTHRARILRKMGMRTNAALIRYAIENGLVE